MTVSLNDREELTARVAMRLLQGCHADYARLREQYPAMLSPEELDELIHTLGPNSGKAFNEGIEPDPLQETLEQVASVHTRPSVVYRPCLRREYERFNPDIDGKWSAVFWGVPGQTDGDVPVLQTKLCDSPEEAMQAFDVLWHEKRAPRRAEWGR